MKNIKVLGTGCVNCKTTFEMIRRQAEEAGVTVNLEKVEDLPAIMTYRVMSTPAVVIDEKLVHSGGVPSRASIQTWLES